MVALISSLLYPYFLFLGTGENPGGGDDRIELSNPGGGCLVTLFEGGGGGFHDDEETILVL